MGTQTEQLPENVLEALRLRQAGDPDCEQVECRTAVRDLSCKGSGQQAYRRFVYPGVGRNDAGDALSEWPDGPRLPRLGGGRAAERRASVSAGVPIGSLVVEYTSDVNHYQARRASVRVGLVLRATNNPELAQVRWLNHRTLKSRPALEVTLPDGSLETVSNARDEAAS